MLDQATARDGTQRGQRLHLRALRRRLIPQVFLSRSSSPTDRAIRWLFPWPVDQYPGQRRGFLSVLGDRLSWSAVRHWLSGRRPMPAWAVGVLADYIEGRCRAGLEIVAELRALPVRPDKRRAGNRERGNAVPSSEDG